MYRLYSSCISSVQNQITENKDDAINNMSVYQD